MALDINRERNWWPHDIGATCTYTHNKKVYTCEVLGKGKYCGVLLIIFNYLCVGVIIHDCVWLYKETFCWFCEPFAVFSLFLNLICAYGERSRVGWLYFIEKRYSDWELDRGGCVPGTAAT